MNTIVVKFTDLPQGLIESASTATEDLGIALPPVTPEGDTVLEIKFNKANESLMNRMSSLIPSALSLWAYQEIRKLPWEEQLAVLKNLNSEINQQCPNNQ